MPKGVALYDYNAGSDQEISFKVIYLVDLGILTRVFKKDIHELVFHSDRRCALPAEQGGQQVVPRGKHKNWTDWGVPY